MTPRRYVAVPAAAILLLGLSEVHCRAEDSQVKKCVSDLVTQIIHFQELGNRKEGFSLYSVFHPTATVSDSGNGDENKADPRGDERLFLLKSDGHGGILYDNKTTGTLGRRRYFQAFFCDASTGELWYDFYNVSDILVIAQPPIDDIQMRFALIHPGDGQSSGSEGVSRMNGSNGYAGLYRAEWGGRSAGPVMWWDIDEPDKRSGTDSFAPPMDREQ
jgi:hypothetical protein